MERIWTFMPKSQSMKNWATWLGIPIRSHGNRTPNSLDGESKAFCLSKASM